MRIKAVIFDLDHTLFDRHGTLRAIVPKLRQRFQTDPALSDEEIARRWIYADDRFVYDGWQYIFSYLQENGVFTEPVEYGDYRSFIFETFAETAVPFPFAKPMLLQLKKDGYRVALMTNGQHALQYKKLALTGLRNVFDSVIVSGDVGVEKPDAEIFRMMCDRLSVKPNEAVYVGDNPVCDIDGAKKAGLYAIWIRSTRVEPAACRPDEIANDVHEIPMLLTELQKQYG